MTGARAPYADRLGHRCERLTSALCAGIDPSPAALALLTDAGSAIGGRLERFGGLIVESVRDAAVAVKFQVAWYELHGATGIRALERTIDYARRAGLVVLADAKRGDVPHSAAAYAEAWLSPGAPLRADALTVNAAVGLDALERMCEIAHPAGAQLYALVHTSNPGAVALQGMPLASGEPWWVELARGVEAAGAGAVVGATQPGVFEAARAAMPTAPLLIPGVGAQGGDVADLTPLATPASAPLLVAASRSLLPSDPCATGGFRATVQQRAEALAAETAPLVATRTRAREAIPGVISPA